MIAVGVAGKSSPDGKNLFTKGLTAGRGRPYNPASTAAKASAPNAAVLLFDIVGNGRDTRAAGLFWWACFGVMGFGCFGIWGLLIIALRMSLDGSSGGSGCGLGFAFMRGWV